MVINVKRLLYPEGDRIIRYPLDKWEKDLDVIFSTILYGNIREGCESRLSLLINQSSLIAVYLGNNEIAYEICYRAVTYFMDLSSRKEIPLTIDPWIDPWVNIGRLLIIERKFQEAHIKFDAINPYLEEYILDKYIIGKSNIKKATLSIMKNCFFYEKLKIYINEENVEPLFYFCKENQQYKEHQVLFLESEVIGLIIQGEFLAAYKILTSSIISIPEKYLPVLLLKLVDICLLLKSSSKEINILLTSLFHQHIDYISQLNLTGLYFCLELCKRLSINEQNEYVGLIESLALARHFSKTYQEKFDLLIEKTKYVQLKKRFLSQRICYPFILGEKLISFLKGEL
jgi:hypothetical protein